MLNVFLLAGSHHAVSLPVLFVLRWLLQCRHLDSGDVLFSFWWILRQSLLRLQWYNWSVILPVCFEYFSRVDSDEIYEFGLHRLCFHEFGLVR